MRPSVYVLAVALAFALTACRLERSEPLVVLIGLDGASFDILDELRAQGRLPNFDRLIRSGTSGPLQSWASKPVMSDNLRRGFWSPIVWTSIATGKVPEKHGIRDFVLPVPGTEFVWMGSEDDPARAEMTFPEKSGTVPDFLTLRLQSYPGVGEQPVDILWNGQRIDTVQLGTTWQDITVPIPEEALRPAQNRVELVFSRQRRPADSGESSDRRRLAGRLRHASVLTGSGRTIFTLNPVLARERLGRGFYPPQGRRTEIQSGHWRAKPVWQLLGESGIPVGIIGFWGTWPAEEVDGFLVSNRMGIREQRAGSKRLTWPRELADELEPLAPTAQELGPTFDALHLSECERPLIDDQSVLKKILIQDEFYVRATKQLLPEMSSGLFSVYLRAIDVAGHPTLHWRYGAEIPPGCPESVRSVMDETYVQVDAWLGEILEALPTNAAVVLVSDHGMQPIEGGGHHAPFGVFVANGDGVVAGGEVSGTTVLDVAPTLMYMLGAAVPLDLDGKIVTSAFESTWLRNHAPRYADIVTSRAPDEELATEASEDALEQLRALGYIE